MPETMCLPTVVWDNGNKSDSSVYSVACILSTVHVYLVSGTVYTTVYIWILYTVQCTCVPCVRHCLHYSVHMDLVHCTMYMCTLCQAMCTLQCTYGSCPLYKGTLYQALCTLYSDKHNTSNHCAAIIITQPSQINMIEVILGKV